MQYLDLHQTEEDNSPMLQEYVPPMAHVSDADLARVKKAARSDSTRVHEPYTDEDLEKLQSKWECNEVGLMLMPVPPDDKVGAIVGQLIHDGGHVLYKIEQ